MSASIASIQNRPQLPVIDPACCTPLLREPITASQAADLAHKLKALADPTRLRLVSMVAAHEGGVWAYYALVPAAMDALSAVLSTSAQPVSA